MYSDHKTHEGNLAAQLTQWKADIQTMQAYATRAEAGIKGRYEPALDAFEFSQYEASHRHSYLKEVREEAWEHAKTRLETTWAELKSHLRRPAGKT